jgi:hypothetical protein
MDKSKQSKELELVKNSAKVIIEELSPYDYIETLKQRINFCLIPFKLDHS